MKDYVVRTFDGINVMESSGDTFVIYDPDRDLPPERMMPFVTIVTGDNYDDVSQLNQPDAYRLNIGLPKARYTALFGATPTERDEHGIWQTGFDHATRDVVMPHPGYAPQHWVCVINPATTLDAARELMAEAHEFAARKHANQRARRT